MQSLHNFFHKSVNTIPRPFRSPYSLNACSLTRSFSPRSILSYPHLCYLSFPARTCIPNFTSVCQLQQGGSHCVLSPFPKNSVAVSFKAVNMWSVTKTFLGLHPVTIVATLLATVVFLWIVSHILDSLYVLDAATKLETSNDCFEDPHSLEKVPLPSVFTPAEKYLTLILPAYNEENRLPSTIQDSLRYLQRRAAVNEEFTYEILIVDDGSKDGTVASASKFVKEYGIDVIRVLKLGVNQGKGAAVRKGVLCSRGELILFADSDGATAISDMQKLEDELLKIAVEQLPKRSKSTSVGKGSRQKETTIADSLGAAFGSRAHLEEGAKAKRAWYRNILTRGFHFCVWLVVRNGIRDTQCGFKMFTRATARLLFPYQRLNRWCFDVELVYLCQRLSIPVKEIQVNWSEIPGSKIRLVSILHMLLELSLIRFGYGLRFWKIHQDCGQYS